MNKIFGIVMGILVFGLFGKSAMSMDMYYLGTCIMIAGFMIGDDGSGTNEKK